MIPRIRTWMQLQWLQLNVWSHPSSAVNLLAGSLTCDLVKSCVTSDCYLWIFLKSIFSLESHHSKNLESYWRMLKVAFITTLKWAYYRVDLRIKRFFVQTKCGVIYCQKMTSLQMCQIKRITPLLLKKLFKTVNCAFT